MQLSSDTSKSLLHEGQINQMKDNSLALAQELTGGQSVQDRVSNVASGTGDCNALGWLVADLGRGEVPLLESWSSHEGSPLMVLG